MNVILRNRGFARIGLRPIAIQRPRLDCQTLAEERVSCFRRARQDSNVGAEG
jgi:hypothetical protein